MPITEIDIPIAEAGQRWAEAQRRRRKPLSEATIESYCDAWASFVRWAGKNERQQASQIGATDPAQWLDSLRGKTDGTVQTYSHGALAVLRFLAEREVLSCELAVIRAHMRDVLPRAPASRAPDVPDLRRLVAFYDPELPTGEIGSKIERERLSKLRNAALLHLLFSTGARISEILALNLHTIRGDNGQIASRVQVTGKGQRRRTVFIRPHAQRALERYVLARRTAFSDSEALLISHGPRGAGGRLGRIAAWAIVTEAAYSLAAGIEGDGRPREARALRAVTPHTFRHFVATWLLNEGAQLSEVSALLGHANTRITEQYYARHTDERLQELHDQFSPDPE